MQDRLLDTKELSVYLGIATSTILEYRMAGRGPVYIKLGHLVRYKKSDVDAWLEAQKLRHA